MGLTKKVGKKVYNTLERSFIHVTISLYYVYISVLNRMSSRQYSQFLVRDNLFNKQN